MAPRTFLKRCRTVTAVLLAAGSLAGCGRRDKPETPPVDTSRGEQLARAYCIACHEFTPPDLLTKKSWNFLLTYMGLRMGIEDFSHLDADNPVEMQVINARKLLVERANLKPPRPMLAPEDWEALRAYYLVNAPEEPLPQPPKPPMQIGLPLFEPKNHLYRPQAPVTSMVHIDAGRGQLFIGDSRLNKVTILDRDLGFVIDYDTRDSMWLRALPTDDGVYLLSIGDLSGDFIGGRAGRIFYGRRMGDIYVTQGVALTDLYRPADMAMGDLDGDGVPEMVVANFGIETGDVSVYRRSGDGVRFETEPVATLHHGPGAVKVALHDFDGDGRLDVAALISDARENFSIFLNRGGLQFERRVIIEKHPAFGYVGFELVDFDRDGRVDIVTVNGDNGDSDPYNTLKRDHGIRIYLNQGGLRFEERWFYPMYGAYGVEVRDFDLDGDFDLAANAFHPDFDAEHPEGFVYLEQTAPFTFAARTHPATFEGRWLTIDAGDLDGDGDDDIVLGAGYVPAGLSISNPELLERMVESGPALLFLENRAIP